jgi:hypothetical protein
MRTKFLDRFRLSRLPSDATVLDAEAFVGLYSLKASPCAKRVVALEPSGCRTSPSCPLLDHGFLQVLPLGDHIHAMGRWSAARQNDHA